MDTSHYSTKESLRDGGEICIRAIQAGDKGELVEAFHHLSEQTIYSRFFEKKKELSDKELAFYTEVDFVRHVALVAALRERRTEQLVGVGRYIAYGGNDGPRRAEVAFTVDDVHQGLGIGTLLLKHLTMIACDAGIKQFVAEVLAQNRSMLRVFEHSGLDMQKTVELGVVHVTLSL